MTEQGDDPVNLALDKLKPVFAQLSFGSVMGYFSGYAAKKIGRAAAVVVGIGFMTLQIAAYNGYVEVDWAKVKDRAVKAVDTVRRFCLYAIRSRSFSLCISRSLFFAFSQTGSGELDVDDAKAYWAKLKKILTFNLGSGAGFSLGFLYGVKHG